MKKLLVLFILLLASPAFADVVLTFDTDTQDVAFDAGTGSVTWADVGGEGMLRLQSDGGWEGQLSKLDASFWGANGMTAEVNDALANGGTISFDILVQDADQTYAAAPGWFEVVTIQQGEFSGWDQEVHAIGLGAAQWPLAGGSYTTSISMDILPGAAAGDANAQYDAGDTWRNLYIGLNNDGANVSNAVVYIDNLTISAVPEPGTIGLLAFLGAGLIARRRR